MRLFTTGGDLRNYLQSYLHEMSQVVNGEEKNHLLNVNEIEYIAYLVDKYRIEPVALKKEELSITDSEKYIPAEHHPSGFFVRSGERYKRQIITYHLPYEGNSHLLSMRPSTFIHWTVDVDISNSMISFEIVNWRDNPEEIKRESEHTIDNLYKQIENINTEVNQYNLSLEGKAKQVVNARKEQLLKQSNLMASLGVPTKVKGSVPQTFAVPPPKKKTIVKKPTAPSTPYSPEPTLDESTYVEILNICHGTGVEIERHPGIYESKDEETLRDHFLMVLAPHFESVTGETFNKKGKTDILIRHDGNNVFVGECKFWRGEKAHLKTIDQILSYLTWRDSKTAIIYFIDNKQLEPVVEKIRSETENHSCFVKAEQGKTEKWFKYHFHLPEDETRGVELSILFFHFPK